MPVKGYARWFVPAVASILVQDYDDVELVVQDSDPVNSLWNDKCARDIMTLLPRVSYEIKPDAGIFYGVNAALRRATGEISCFACSDDLLCPGALIAVNEAFERERFGGPHWLYGQTVSAHVSGREQGVDPAKPVTLAEMLGHNRLGSPAVFWNRQLMGLTGSFDPRYRWAADYDLWLRFWQRCEPEYLAQTLGVFRHHAEQATETHRAALEQEAAAIAQRHRTLGSVIARARNVFESRRFFSEVTGAECS